MMMHLFPQPIKSSLQSLTTFLPDYPTSPASMYTATPSHSSLSPPLPGTTPATRDGSTPGTSENTKQSTSQDTMEGTTQGTMPVSRPGTTSGTTQGTPSGTRERSDTNQLPSYVGNIHVFFDIGGQKTFALVKGIPCLSSFFAPFLLN